MNVARALDVLMARLGGRTSSTLRSSCLAEMSLIQSTVMERMEELPWFLMSEEASSLTVPGERRILLPSDFIKEVEDDNLYLLNDDGNLIDIAVTTYDDARDDWSDIDTGPPVEYVVRGQYIFLYPIPDYEYTIRFPSYYARQPTPEDSVNSENQWFKWVPDLVIGKTGLVMAGFYTKDSEVAGLFASMQAAGQKQLDTLTVAREEANRSRVMDPKPRRR